MQKTYKKLIAIFCVLMIVSSSVLAIDTLKADAGNTPGVLFSEDFNSYTSSIVSENTTAMAAKGWNADDTIASYNTGTAYTVPHDKQVNLVLNNLSGATAWTDYSVEAMITVDDTSGASGTTYAYISGRLGSVSNTTGYDLILMQGFNAQGATLRLKSGSNKLGEDYTFSSLPKGTAFKLKMEFKGTVIKCYLNDEEVMTYDTKDDATKYISGYAGIRKLQTTGRNVTFDDLVVKELPQESTGELFFDDFNSYTSTTVSENTAAMVTKGWNADDTLASYNTGTAYMVPHDKQVNLVLNNLSGATAWTDYSVEATITVDDTSGTSGTTYAFISGRLSSVSNTTGYDLILMQGFGATGATLRLKSGSNKLGEDYTISSLPKGTPFKLKMEFKGTVIKCYLNDEEVKTYDTQNDATQYTSGYVGLRKSQTTGRNVTFDDLVVKELPQESTGELFFDDFNSYTSITVSENTAAMVTKGWNADDTLASYNTGTAYMVPHDKQVDLVLNNLSGATAWTDYSVEATITIDDTSGTSGTTYAFISGRLSSVSNTTGYDLILMQGFGATGATLRLKSGSNKLGEDYTISSLPKGTPFKLKMEFKGTVIKCYLNDEEVKTYDTQNDATKYTTGYAGLRKSQTTGRNIIFDDFTVAVLEDTVQPGPTPEPEPEGYPEGYLYFNDFESDKKLNQEGFDSNSNGTKGNGVYTLNGTSYNYLTKVEDSLDWTDYVVEADVMINDDGTIPQYASIVARSMNKTNNGYEYRIVRDKTGTYIQLYKRGATSGLINGQEYKFNVSIIPGDYNHMKMVVKGAEIICYFNGIRFFQVTDSEAYLTGYAGVRSPAGTATQNYDNLGVRQILDSDLAKESVLEKADGDVWFYDNFRGEDALTDRGWNTNDMEIRNGAVDVLGRLYVDGLQGCEKWTDYEVSAVVTVDKSSGLRLDAVEGQATICARTLSKETGYEFGIATPESASPFLRLRDRVTGTKWEDTSIAITEGPHTLRMVCMGNEITCYYDEQLVFAVQSDSNAAGYAGMRASGYAAYYQNFKVGKATMGSSSITGSNGQTVSPITGDSFSPIANISFVTLVVSTFGLIITILYARRNKQADAL